MWLTRLSISRPVTIMMLVLTLVVFGIKSYISLPVELYPDINMPMVVILTTYQGAGPEEIENTITKPIEDQMSTINGLDTLSSTSSEASSMVMVQFKMDMNIDESVAEVRDKMDMVKSRLPDDASTPFIIKIDPNIMPIVVFTFTSAKRSEAYLRNLAEDVVVDRLSQQSGIASVGVYGGDVREIQVVLDPGWLAAYGVTQSQVVQALAAENLNLPAGTIKETETNYSIRVLGEFQDITAISDVFVPNSAGNPNLTVGDLMISGVAADTFVERNSYARHNGQPGVAITVQKQSKFNTVDAVNNALKEFERMTGKPFLPQNIKAAEAAAKRGEVYRVKGGGSPVIPADIEINTVSDQSTVIENSLEAVMKSLIEGALLAVLIVFLFLHSTRSTFIVALAIPISMIGTFAVMDLLNFSINIMSMLGLSLSVGILVDDSIVVIENIYRHLRQGESPKEAAFNGRTEIGLAAMTITLVDVVVFVPLAMASGIAGMMFRQFGITIAVAALFSLLVSFTVTPMLASRWLVALKDEPTHNKNSRTEKNPIKKAVIGLNNIFGKLFNAWERGYDKLHSFYIKTLAWSLDHRAAVICMGIMIFITAVSTVLPQPWYAFLNGGVFEISRMIPFMGIIAALLILVWVGTAVSNRGARRENRTANAKKPLLMTFLILIAAIIIIPTKFSATFMPEADTDTISITVRKEIGTNIEETNKTLLIIEKELANKEEFPDIKQITVTIGGGGIFSSGEEEGSIDLDLKERASFFDRFAFQYLGAKRPKLRAPSSQEIASSISAKYANMPGVKLTTSTSSGMGRGMGGGGLSVEVRGKDMEALQRVASNVQLSLEKIDGTFDVEQSWRSGRPEVQLRIDSDRAARFGLTVAQIASTMRTAVAGDTSLTYRDAGEEYDIRVIYPKSSRAYSDDIMNVIVGTTSAGTPVYARDVTIKTDTFGPTQIDRTDRMRIITVSAKLKPGKALAEVQRIAENRVKEIDTTGTVIHWGGQSEMMQESFSDLILALVLSLVLVFILMSILFENTLSPLIIMLAVPQAIAGAIFAMSYTNTSLSIISLVGIIMLVGLVSKNSILIVDYTNTLRERDGLSRREALLKAGPIRMQPILMTTAAMIFGMLPTALSFNAGSAIRQPLGVVVIGGLLLAMFLSLLMVPAFYEIMDSVSNWLTKKKNQFLKLFEV